MRVFCVLIMAMTLVAGSAGATAGQSDVSSRPAIPSAGCGTSDIDVGQHSDRTINDTHELPWQLLVPSTHDGVTPVPLVISLHGGYESGYTGLSRFTDLGEEQGFAVVAPRHSRYGAWMYWFEDTAVDATAANPDVVLVDALIDDLDERLCLDLARVYASGFSGGAWGTAVLGCALEDRLAALAPVAASLDLGDACDLERPVPLIAFHGTADEAALFEGGISEELLDSELPWGGRWRDTPANQADAWRVVGRSVPERLAGIAVRNGCEPEPTSESVADDVERLTWACPEGAEVELVVIDGGTHVWPTLPTLDASELMWDFFEQHSLPE